MSWSPVIPTVHQKNPATNRWGWQDTYLPRISNAGLSQALAPVSPHLATFRSFVLSVSYDDKSVSGTPLTLKRCLATPILLYGKASKDPFSIVFSQIEAVVEEGSPPRVPAGDLRIYFAGGAYAQISSADETALAVPWQSGSINRETVGRYLRLSKPAVSTAGFEEPCQAKPAQWYGEKSQCEPLAEVILLSPKCFVCFLAQRIYRDLVEENGLADSHESVNRFVRKLRTGRPERVWRLGVSSRRRAADGLRLGRPDRGCLADDTG